MEEEKKAVKTDSDSTVQSKPTESAFSLHANRIGSNEKVHLKKLEYENILTGEYDESGTYKIRQEFLEELVKVNKLVKEEFEGRYYAVSQNKTNPKLSLKFSVVIEDDGLQRVATLSLLEEVDDVSQAFKKTVSTIIAKYRDDSDIYFFSKVKKIFNLITTDDTIENSMDENLVPLLMKAKLGKLSMKHWLDKFSEEIDEIYIKKMMLLLKSSGKYGEFVLKNFMKLKSEKGEGFLSKDSPYYYKRMAMLLDISLLKARTYPISSELLAQIKGIQKERNERFLSVFEQKYSPLQIEQEASKKPAVKSVATEKSGGKGGKKSSTKSSSSAGKGAKKKSSSKKIDLEEESSSDENPIHKEFDKAESTREKLLEEIDTLTNGVAKKTEEAKLEGTSHKVVSEASSVKSLTRGSEGMELS